MSNSAQYNQNASRYTKANENKPIQVHYARPNILSLLPQSIQNLSILDIGCGGGWYAEKLHGMGAKVTAIDSSESMIDLTQDRLNNQINTHVVDLEKPLDIFKDSQFDILFAPLVLHYIQDWDKLFKEFSRILKPNGQFIFSIHHPHTDIQLHPEINYFSSQKLTETWQEPKMTVEFYHHSLDNLCENLYKNGFTIEQLREPMPDKKLKSVEPDLYEKLMTQPWFLFGCCGMADA